MAHDLAAAVILGIHVALDAVLVGDDLGFTLGNPSCIALAALFCIGSRVDSQSVFNVPSAKNFSRL
jgi:hypothetical protein